jgi:Ankyrin repeats (3 copies)
LKYSVKDRDLAFVNACKNGRIDNVIHLLTGKELSPHARINALDSFGNSALSFACAGGYIDIVKYMLESKDLRRKANMFAGKSDIFLAACADNKEDVLMYLLYDKKYPLTDTVMTAFNKKIKPEYRKSIKAMIAKRDLLFNLQEDLSIKAENKKLMKI